MPGARGSGRHENRIIGPDYAVSLSEADMQPSLHAAEKKRVALTETLFSLYFGARSKPGPTEQPVWSEAILIGLGGSDRRYFRVRNDGRTAVLMECRPDDPDYERHLVYTGFFGSHTVPVPALLSSDEATKRALFEDLGDTSLYSYMKLPHDNGRIEDVYRRVLDIAIKLHATSTENIHECPLLQARIFDYDHLRWETTYFLDRFVVGLKMIEVMNRHALEDELHRLAQKVDACPKSVIHRDFQCQNIMMTKGLPRVIDFQGARMAPPAYDIASMLWDPYHRLDDSVREKLMDYYLGEMKKHSKEFDERAFFDSLIPCRLQRHMQALGAYGFLSAVKGKKYFLKHVPEAMRLLREESEAMRHVYPHLFTLVRKIE
jgi:aminoglycoside/choline kinase family phosphotransferase